MRPTLFVVYEDMKTVKDNFSIKVVLLSILIISVLPYVILSRFSGLGSEISNTVSVLLILMQLLLPYLAMRLSYTSISGEIERNNHRLLLTFPVSRLNLVLGKWISRSIATAVGVLLYVSTSLITSTVVYNSMNIQDVAWITFTTMLLGTVFCAIGVTVSCVTDASSIVPDVLITLVYLPVVLFWRIVPFLIKIISEGGGVSNLPSPDYSGFDYLLLRLNPLESHASLVSWGISSDINIFIPSSLRVPDVVSGGILTYSTTPTEPTQVPIYAQEMITVPLSVLIPIALMAYGYWKFKNKEL